MESLCGYISVLPGCFSAYRYESLKGTPLRQYFSYVENPMVQMSPFKANMYLVEDRLLCMELFAKSDASQTLHAERKAISETDVCTDLIELLKQRRRWYNGTFCAMLFMLFQYYRILFHPRHSIIRKLLTIIDFGFYLYFLVSGWFLTGIYVLFIDLNLMLFLENNDQLALLWIIRGLFWGLLLSNLTVGLIGNPKQWRPLYNLSATFFGALFGFVTCLAVYFTVSGERSTRQNFLIGCLLLNLGVYIMVGFFYGEFVTVLLSFWQWWCSLPVYVLMIPIYAFANLNDVSWGTKNCM
jgi:chitin synthase